MRIYAYFGRRQFTTLMAHAGHLAITSEPKLCKKDNVPAEIANHENCTSLQTRF